jgi:hypothetical protein
MRIYDLQPHQKELAKSLLKLNQNNLHYLVSQPNENFKNHTISEIRKHIKSGIRKYSKDFLLHNYYSGAENQLFQYVAFIEYPKEFYLSISKVDADIFSMYKGVHFHLFISSKSIYVDMNQLFYYIFRELSSQEIKQQSIRKYDYKKIDSLTKEFAEYHTKQHYHYIDSDRVLSNI